MTVDRIISLLLALAVLVGIVRLLLWHRASGGTSTRWRLALLLLLQPLCAALLYAALLAQPVLGFLGSNAFGFPMAGATAFLGLFDQPRFMATDEALGTALIAAHRLLGWATAALLLLHVAAVVFHQAIRKDGTLLRMV